MTRLPEIPIENFRSAMSDVRCLSVLRQVEVTRQVMEGAIHVTPTGKRRNLLTEINMELMLMEEKMKVAITTRVNEGG